MTHILSPITEPFEPHIAKILSGYPNRNGYILKLFRVFANSTRFLTKGVANLLDKESPITVKLREIVILRVCANNNCEYEWGVHVAAFSQYAGLSEEQVAQTRHGDHRSACWSKNEALLIHAIDELCANGAFSDEVIENFQTTWTVEEQLEILALCGNYHTICFVANASRIANESFGAKFP